MRWCPTNAKTIRDFIIIIILFLPFTTLMNVFFIIIPCRELIIRKTRREHYAGNFWGRKGPSTGPTPTPTGNRRIAAIAIATATATAIAIAITAIRHTMVARTRRCMADATPYPC